MDTHTMMRRRNLRVIEQLLGELEAQRYDSGLTQRILAAPGAFPLLLRACFLAREGMHASARADIERALACGRDNPVVELVAGMISYTTRDYQRALELFERAAALSVKAAPRARRQIIAAAEQLGWELELRRASEAGLAAAPQDPSWHAHTARSYTRGRDWPKALEHTLAALELAPTAGRLWMEAASLHAKLDQGERSAAALSRARSLLPQPTGAPPDTSEAERSLAARELASALTRAGQTLRELGKGAEAVVALEACASSDPGCVGAVINLALAYQATGRGDELDTLWVRLRDQQAPGLLSDAARELGLVLVGDDDGRPETTAKLRVLELALEMVGREPSSWSLPSYRTHDGELRFVRSWPHAGPGPHARDHEQLEQAKRMLLEALTHYSGPRPWSP